VVGGGLESLVAACSLARAGVHTRLVERRETPGGTRAPWPEADGFRVPLLSDGPARLHSGAARACGLSPDLFDASATHAVAALCPDGAVLELGGESDRVRSAIARFSSKDADAYGRFEAQLSRVAAAIAPVWHRAPHPGRPGVADLWTAGQSAVRYLGLSKPEAFALLRWAPMAVADLVSEWFESEPLRALIAALALSGVFAGPRSPGTGVGLLLRELACDSPAGTTPAVRGGSTALVQALVQQCTASGVEVSCASEVTRLLVEDDRVASVELANGTRVPADIVVSGIGPQRTLLDLVEPGVLPPEVVRRILNIRARGTLARVLLILDDLPVLGGQPVTPTAHDATWHLAPTLDYLERAFDAMKYGRWAPEPWIELHVHHPPAAARPSSGGCALSITAHMIPERLRADSWSSAREAFGDAIASALEGPLPGIRARVVRRIVLTPEDTVEGLGLAGGHPLHAELALDQLWMARPALGLGGYRAPVAGLYLCGPGTHPGLGPAGMSGWLAAKHVLEDVGARTTRGADSQTITTA
jgi:phytoene dehydrogenase-like protein